ncbi:MAG: hypothetical protein ACFCVK_09445 [Acidimicrobiales bacterium]
MRAALDVVNLVGYCQINHGPRYQWAGVRLHTLLDELRHERPVAYRVEQDTEIWGALRTIFAPEPDEVLT